MSNTIDRIVDALLAKACEYFPEHTITWELVAVGDITVCRITHSKLIRGEANWLAVVDVVDRWTSGRNAVALQPVSNEDAIYDYNAYIGKAALLNLFPLPKNFPVSLTSTWVVATKQAKDTP